jgi:hypothetical protein
MKYLPYLSIVLCIVILCIHAWIMPVQYDEAAMILSIQKYGALSAFTMYEGGTNNHVLLSFITGILLKAGVHSAFIFRLPVLLAALAAFFALDRLTKHLATPWRVILPLFVTITPLFFDNLVMTRGYPIGLAFLLWGWLSFDRSIVRTSILWALAVATVPTFAIDVVMLSIGLALAESNGKRAFKCVALAALLALLPYSLIADDVIKTILSLSGESKIYAVRDFTSSMGGASCGAIVFIICIAAAANLYKRDATYYPLILFPSLLLIPIGYARTHLLLGILLIVTLFSALPVRYWVVILTGYSLLSFPFLRWDTPITQPNVWPATGFAIARTMTPCLTVQKKGIFIVLHDYYQYVERTGEAANAHCDDFIMTLDDDYRLPTYLRMHGEILTKYGVGMFKQKDLQSYGSFLLKNQDTR